MAFVPAPNCVQVEILATKDGQQIENRFIIDVLTTPTPTIVDAVANLVNNWTQATYFDHIVSTVTLRGVQATDISAIDGSQVFIAPTGPFTGALGGPAMPNEVTLCMQLKTPARGRSARGRCYILGLARSDVTGENTFWDTRAADLIADFNTLLGLITAAGWSWVILSRVSGGVPRPGGPVVYPVTSFAFIDLVVDSMRRRKPGVGS
jgi:hypothetical protein